MQRAKPPTILVNTPIARRMYVFQSTKSPFHHQRTMEPPVEVAVFDNENIAKPPNKGKRQRIMFKNASILVCSGHCATWKQQQVAVFGTGYVFLQKGHPIWSPLLSRITNVVVFAVAHNHRIYVWYIYINWWLVCMVNVGKFAIHGSYRPMAMNYSDDRASLLHAQPRNILKPCMFRTHDSVFHHVLRSHLICSKSNELVLQ